MVDWASRIVTVFHKLKCTVKKVSNPIICQELTEISISFGGGYLLGNENLERHLSYWIQLAQERTARERGEVLVVAPGKVFEQLEAGRKEVEEMRKEKRIIQVDSVQPDSVEDESPVADLTKHTPIKLKVGDREIIEIHMTKTRGPEKDWNDPKKCQLLRYVNYLLQSDGF